MGIERKICSMRRGFCTLVLFINEFDDVAVFPSETSGRFNHSAIDTSGIYIVNGEAVNVDTTPATSTSGVLSPSQFGAYTGPTSHIPPPRSSLSLRKKPTTFRKTIAVVSLSNSNKPSTSKASTQLLDYKIVTQVVVTLEAGHCSPLNVAELVRQQVGFEVILLDSKCFPVLESDTTMGIDFWKSNRKILAASQSLYKKLTGSSTSVKRANDQIDLTLSDCENSGPKSKHKCLSSDKLDSILSIVKSIKERNDLAEKIGGFFECVICRDIVKKPQYSPCCHRVVACESCISRWFSDHSLCPHCSTPGQLSTYTEIRGIDEMLDYVRSLVKKGANDSESATTPTAGNDESDSDFELPAVNIRQQLA